MRILTRDQCLERIMTPKQKTVFLAIDEFWKAYGYGPSVDEIMAITQSTSRGSVNRIMKLLCEANICKRVERRARSIRPSYMQLKSIDK